MLFWTNESYPDLGQACWEGERVHLSLVPSVPHDNTAAPPPRRDDSQNGGTGTVKMERTVETCSLPLPSLLSCQTDGTDRLHALTTGGREEGGVTLLLSCELRMNSEVMPGDLRANRI
ncbi:hypothetical protein SKAU_G00201480 [Synaphobranchus kaupii]|uniref:Uncharacterized protein n=1 Tax=Synaphobranchus kaupii TaxID=118154 RepID=A0A9Q1IXC3_SYNKA|nr:hypothetical protein SKAU_G00201480 [Synaphobranchus kaupii]